MRHLHALLVNKYKPLATAKGSMEQRISKKRDAYRTVLRQLCVAPLALAPMYALLELE